ncbi:hypothetical protein [Mycobacterium sp. HM-7]
MSASIAERRLCAQKAAHLSWANTADRSARTLAARRGLLDKFDKQVEHLPPSARAAASESLRKAYYAGLAAKSVAARRRRKGMARRPGEYQPDAENVEA